MVPAARDAVGFCRTSKHLRRIGSDVIEYLLKIRARTQLNVLFHHSPERVPNDGFPAGGSDPIARFHRRTVRVPLAQLHLHASIMTKSHPARFDLFPPNPYFTPDERRRVSA